MKRRMWIRSLAIILSAMMIFVSLPTDGMTSIAAEIHETNSKIDESSDQQDMVEDSSTDIYEESEEQIDVNNDDQETDLDTSDDQNDGIDEDKSSVSGNDIIDEDTEIIVGEGLTYSVGSLNIDFANGVLTISGSGSLSAEDLKELYSKHDKSEINKLIFKDGVASIGEQAFYGCSNITSINLVNGIHIENYAFGSCDSLNRLDIPKDTIIGARSFAGCDNLKEVSIPYSSIMYEYAFEDCESLEKVYIGEDVSIKTDNLSSSFSAGYFSRCPKLISAGPVESGANIEFGYKEDFPAALFAYSSIENVVFPNEIKSIGAHCFAHSNLKRVSLPDGIKVSYYAFSGCEELEKVIIPANVKLVLDNKYDSACFANCTKLTSAGPLNSGCAIEYGWKYTIPERAFESSCIESIEFPESITTISEGAFEFCNSLKSVVIPNGVTGISKMAFSGCTSLEEVSLHNGVTYIDVGSFDNCISLKSIYIPNSVSSINRMSFRYVDYDKQIDKNLDIVIECYRDSYAYTWANRYNYVTKVIGESQDDNSNKLTIDFDPNGGDGYIESISIVFNKSKRLPKCIFTRNGYSFIGWNTEKEGSGTSYSDEATFSNSVDENRSVTLYAQWKKIDNASQIRYELNGGVNNAGNPSSLQWGKTFTLLNPTRNGYKFAGWYGDSKFRVKHAKVIGKQGINYTLYAKWTPNTYKVKYVYPKGAVKGKNPTSYKPSDATKILQPAVRKGYAFTGWYTDVNLTNRITQIESGSYGDITLYSGWTASSYTIVYNGNGATGGSTPDSYHKYKTSGVISENGYTKTGYTFSNWYKNAKCTGTKYIPGNGDNDLAYIDGTIVNLYAGWTPNKYSVIYNGNGATSGSTKTSTFKYDDVKCTIAKNGFKREGYEFAEWNTKADGTGTSYKASAKGAHNLTTGTGAVTLYAQWKPILRVTYDGNGSTGGSVKPTILKYGTKNTLASNNFNRTGYIFVEWNTRADGSGKAYKAKANSKNELISDDPEGNTTLYAQWKPITYTIVLDAKDKNQPAVKIKAKYDENIILPNNTFVKKGYYFTEWFSLKLQKLDSVKLGFYPAGSIVKNLSSKDGDTVTLYPKWAYKVYYDANGGTGSMDASEFFFDTNGNLTKNQFSKNGYTFNGWKAEINKKTKSFEDGQSVKDLVNSDGTAVTLKAQWSPKSCYIYYNPNTGNAASDKKNEKKVEYKYGTEYAIKKNDFKRKGYVFDSWNTSPNGDGTRYEVGQKVVNPPSKLYAYWKQDIKVTSVAFNQKEITVRLNQPTCMYQYVTVLPQNAAVNKLSWKSSNTTIAKIDQDGNLTGLKEGTITITATSTDGTKKSCTIKVNIVNKTEGDIIAEIAEEWMPYVNYGNNIIREKMDYQEVTLDCIGFAIFVYAQNGYADCKDENKMPWGTYYFAPLYPNALNDDEMNRMYDGDFSALQKGDLIFFYNDENTKLPGHVGIYVGDGCIIHSLNYGINCIKSQLSDGKILEAPKGKEYVNRFTMNVSKVVKVVRLYQN